MKSKTFSEADEKKRTWLFKYVKTIHPEADDFDFIEKYKRQIMSIIEKHPTWGDSSKEGLFFLVAKDLRENGYDRYSKMYSEMGYKYLKKNREKENEGKQSEKEILNYRDHEFLIDILDNINYDEIQTINGHYQYLLLSMLVLQPPVRTDFYCTSQFIRTKQENDSINNFIRIDRKGKLKIYYIINNDKVSKTRVYAINKELSKIKIENKKLVDLINDSYIKYPRKYLFEIKDKPVSQVTLLSFLKKITKVDGINNDMMRSSYINWFYKNHKSLKDRELLALQMRHSIITAMRNYQKVDEEPPEEKKEKTVKTLQNEIFEIKENIENNDNDNNDKLYRKRRRDVVRTLNNGSIPRESTLTKYNIKFDTETKKYS
jgi:hypothetical protein